MDINLKISKLLAWSVFFFLMSASKCDNDFQIEIHSENPYNLAFYIDAGYPHVMIMSKDIDCEKLSTCTWYDQKTYSAVYRGTDFKFRYAYVTLAVPSLDPDEKDPKILRVFSRITETLEFNVLGINDINAITNPMEHRHEMVIDLKNRTIGIQPFKKTNGSGLICAHGKIPVEPI